MTLSRQSGPLPLASSSGLTITAVRLRRLRLNLDPPFRPAWDPEPRRAFDATLVTIETNEGVVGVGSGDTMDAFEPFVPLFLGRDPLQIAHHVRVLESINFHAGRYWPFEAALWDIIGQVCGQPVSVLFGGALDRLPVYASCAESLSPPARAEVALRLRAEGFRAIKLRINPAALEEGMASARAIREAVGDSMEIMVDLNQAWRMSGDVTESLSLPVVRRIADRLRDLGIFWLEEPLAGSDVKGLANLRATTGVRLAGGEMARTLDDLLRYLDADALDVYQPDVVLAVGLWRTRMIAELALARHRQFSPHTWTNGLGLLANLHVAAGVGGGPFLEFPYDPPGWTPERRDFFLAEPLRIGPDGCLAVPARPGLGVVLDDEAVERYSV